MNKKTIYYSLLIIPISLFVLLLTLFLTNIWKPSIVAIIFITILLIIVAIFTWYLIKNSYSQFDEEHIHNFEDNFKQRFWKLGIIGFIADFCDTIGIGSFAVSIILLKLTKQVRNDKKILGIMNVGHSIPTCLEAIIFIALIQVAWPTLVSLISAATLGAYLGAIIANKIKLSWSQLFIGVLLFIVSIIMLLGQKQIGIMPTAGNNNSLDIWWKYLVGISIFFILGAFMALGIGIYAPAMATTYLLGLNAECAFPIMMGSAAFLMPVAGTRFIKDKNYEIKPPIAFTLGGSIGVICAYLSVFLLLQNGLGLNKEQFINILLWLIIVIIWYTSSSLIITSVKNLRNYKKQKSHQKLIIDS
ncbi:MAG: sulfite exporter TauE/SafE family protein [Spiroplasma endosymbiont of Drosophila atripex]|nr:MAG: sulfite exporter TauE/SafE family protein [Spiroplasma endosymbiont of Drosophila atripex]